MKLKETIRMAATVRATVEGLKRVDAARCKKGWSKRDEAWAGLATTSESTLGRFWSGVPIRAETFKQICLAVGIAESDWEELVSPEASQSTYGQDRKGHAVITLGVSLDDISPEDWHLVSTKLAKYGMSVIDMAEGSIKLLLEGTPEDIAALTALYQSGELSAVLSTLVQSVQRADKDGLAEWIRENNKEDWHLSGADLSFATLFGATLSGADLIGANLSYASLIRATLSDATLSYASLNGANLNGANLIGSKLRRADLIGAKLRGATLIGAKLRGANLSGADLREANVTVTQFGSGRGLTEPAKADLKTRGALFDDGGRDREESPVPIPSGRR